MTVVAIGRRMPDWVAAGFAEYAGRFSREVSLHLQALAEPVRSKAMDSPSVRRLEAEALQRAIPAGSLRIVLDTRGQGVDTLVLSRHFQRWQESGQDVCFLIGGADGLAPELVDQADWVWSLSPLTFPHMLVRIIVAEQLYRVWSLLRHHPYHRE